MKKTKDHISSLHPRDKMTPEKVQIILENRDEIEKYIFGERERICKKISDCYEELNSGLNVIEAGIYKSPIANYGMCVQHSVNDDPFYSLFAQNEGRYSQRLVELIRKDEAWAIMEDAIDYMFQQIVFMDETKKAVIRICYMDKCSLCSCFEELNLSRGRAYEHRKMALAFLCNEYNEYISMADEAGRLRERLEEFRLFWGDYENIG